MLESNNNTTSGVMKTTLIAKIDKRVVPALDLIAATNQVKTGQFMSQFFSDIADTVEFLAVAQGGSFASIEDKFAGLIIRRCPEATPEALRFVGHIWGRAAELKVQERGA